MGEARRALCDGHAVEIGLCTRLFEEGHSGGSLGAAGRVRCIGFDPKEEQQRFMQALTQEHRT